MSTATKLPDKLSDLIDVALVDLEACEADPRYKIDMEYWHSPFHGKCEVCLAGSVIAQRLGASPTSSSSPRRFVSDARIAHRLWALDFLRSGNIASACRMTGFDLCGCPSRVDVSDYRRDPAAFKADMRRLATTLREHGL